MKAIGWFIEEYGIAQISMNITDVRATPLHLAFEECCKSADRRGLRVTGSELVGLVPLAVMLDAGRYFLEKQQRSVGVSEEELLKIAIKSMGLEEISPFDPSKKIIEKNIEASGLNAVLLKKNLREFANETASESPAPGGGSISAYVGALGVSLATMVANLSSHKKGWDARWQEFSEHAAAGQKLKDALLRLVDEDTAAFNLIMAAFQLPNSTADEKAARKSAIQAATKTAIEVPLLTARLAAESMNLIEKMVEIGNPNSVTDAAVGALCARAAVHGAFLNVKINAAGLADKEFAGQAVSEAEALRQLADEREAAILKIVNGKIG